MLLTSKLIGLARDRWVVALIASAITLGIFIRIERVDIPEVSAEAEKSGETSARLQAGESSEGELVPGEARAYRFNLESGQYVRILVDPSPLNLSLRLTDPDDRLLLELENREREPTPLSAIADKPGPYSLEVRTLEKAPGRIRYKLQVNELRATTAKDPQKIDAEKDFATAEQLLREWKAESSRSAIEKLRVSLSLWKTVGERDEQAITLKRIGDVYQRFGESKEALDSYNQALALWRGVKDVRHEADALNEIGYVHITRGDNQKAQQLCRDALKLSQATANPYGQARALNNLGEVSYGLGRLKESLDFYEKALSLWRNLGDRRGQALALLNLAYTYSDIGQMRGALDYYNQSLPLWIGARDQRGQSMTLTAIGRLYSRMGESQQALNHFEQALQLIEPIGAPAEKGRILTGMADIYNQLDKKREAIEYYDQALPLFRTSGDYSGEVGTIYDAAGVLNSLGDYSRSLEYLQQALAISKAANDLRLQAFEIRQMGRVYAALGDEAKALDHYHRSLAFWHREKDFRAEADTLNPLGRFLEARGEVEKARDYYSQALQLSRKAEYRMGEAATLHNLARLERDRGNLNDARAFTQSAIEVIESLRTKVASQELRASYFASVRQHYELYMDVLMQLDKVRPAEGFAAAGFAISEKARARSLLESLQEARADIRQGVDINLLERERSLQQTLYEKTARHAQVLGSSSDAAEAEALSKEIDRLSIEYEEVRSQIRSSSPRYAALTQVQPLSLSKIQQQVLDDGSLMLEYALGDERSYVWAITRSEIFSYELPARSEIETAAQDVYTSLTASQPLPGETLQQTEARVAKANEQLPAQIAQLSRIILGPVSSRLGTKRLLVVPDGALQYVPFQILTAPPQTTLESPTTESRALFLDHEIVNEPSASALALLIGDTAGRKQAAKTIAVFADPVFEADDPRINSANPIRNSRVPQNQETDSQRALRDVGVAQEGGHIPRLQASQREAEAIRSVTPWWSGFEATGFEASRATVMRPDMANYRILHFATHGLLNDKHPELSGVVLSLFDEQGQRQEGFLRLHDIYNLKLPVDLVVLSACNTGLGKDVRGEGLIGLTRGFMYAGASSVVASLWKVDDEATAELMRYFYSYMLKDGLSPAAALRKAQVKMSQQKRWQSPYYWSGFIIQGQYIQSETVKGWRFTSLTVGAGVLAILIVAMFFVLKQRRRRIL